MKLTIDTPAHLFRRLLHADERADLERVLANVLGAGTKLVAMRDGEDEWRRATVCAWDAGRAAAPWECDT